MKALTTGEKSNKIKFQLCFQKSHADQKTYIAKGAHWQLRENGSNTYSKYVIYRAGVSMHWPRKIAEKATVHTY